VSFGRVVRARSQQHHTYLQLCLETTTENPWLLVATGEGFSIAFRKPCLVGKQEEKVIIMANQLLKIQRKFINYPFSRE
jgi:hypothetical protein